MVDEVKEPVVTEPVAIAEDFNAGFLEGLETPEPDPLDFADKPVVAKADPVAETPIEPVVETPVAVVETPAKVEPAPVDTAQIIDMLDKRLPKEPSPFQPAPVAVTPVKEPEPVKPALSEAETARLVELAKEWPDVQEMLSLQQRSFADAVSKEVAKQMAGVTAELNAFKTSMKPVQDSVHSSVEERYDAAVRATHPEMYDPKGSDAFADELVDWVKQQPAWMRGACVEALNSPNPQDAVELISQFKAATGKVAPVVDASEPTAPAGKTDKEKRLEQMAKPTSRQTKGAESDDPLDFEGGFKEMAREIARAG